ncbi:MAG: hypothetical protein MK036_07435, partial [Dehalococcoidia bacterium]|nr:hypothetical protein [Dehalococcoidia bacterium]
VTVWSKHQNQWSLLTRQTSESEYLHVSGLSGISLNYLRPLPTVERETRKLRPVGRFSWSWLYR